ncbi:hypothetical protein HDU67_003571 [Dinochytrium kinnereticum]|nr:hypothetical protein HDU67_003571 [Dinochytrium kinnereticum]
MPIPLHAHSKDSSATDSSQCLYDFTWSESLYQVPMLTRLDTQPTIPKEPKAKSTEGPGKEIGRSKAKPTHGPVQDGPIDRDKRQVGTKVDGSAGEMGGRDKRRSLAHSRNVTGLGLHLHETRASGQPLIGVSKACCDVDEPPSPSWTWGELCGSVVPIIPNVVQQRESEIKFVETRGGRRRKGEDGNGVKTRRREGAGSRRGRVSLGGDVREVVGEMGVSNDVGVGLKSWEKLNAVDVVVPLAILVACVSVALYLLLGSSERLFDD